MGRRSFLIHSINILYYLAFAEGDARAFDVRRLFCLACLLISSVLQYFLAFNIHYRNVSSINIKFVLANSSFFYSNAYQDTLKFMQESFTYWQQLFISRMTMRHILDNGKRYKFFFFLRTCSFLLLFEKDEWMRQFLSRVK